MYVIEAMHHHEFRLNRLGISVQDLKLNIFPTNFGIRYSSRQFRAAAKSRFQHLIPKSRLNQYQLFFLLGEKKQIKKIEKANPSPFTVQKHFHVANI